MKACERCETVLSKKQNRFCSKSCFWQRERGDCEVCASPLVKQQKRFCSNACRSTVPGPRTGMKNSTEHQLKIVAANTGKKRTAEQKQFISEQRKGKMTGASHHLWNPDREDQHIKNTAKKICYSLLHRVLSSNHVKKNAKCYDMLGYTPTELRAHLESLFTEGMTWKNRGMFGWHIDHIVPVCSFPPGTPPSVVNALSNLRPLWSTENLQKSVEDRKLKFV